MRKKIISVLLIALLLLSSLVFAACKKSSDEDVSDTVDIDELMEEEAEADEWDGPDDSEDPAYVNEMDGAEIVRVGHNQEDFYGSWSAKSQQAHHLFGNADFTINKDGSWTGNIVEEDFQGKWIYEDESVIIKSDDGLINYRLFYVQDGNMMFEDLDDANLTPLVLKKQ